MGKNPRTYILLAVLIVLAAALGFLDLSSPIEAVDGFARIPDGREVYRVVGTYATEDLDDPSGIQRSYRVPSAFDPLGPANPIQNGTFRVVFTLPRSDGAYSVRVPRFSGATGIWVNGALLWGSRSGTDSPITVSLHGDPNAEVVVRYEKGPRFAGGPWFSEMVVGSDDALGRYKTILALKEFGVAGVVLALSFLFFWVTQVTGRRFLFWFALTFLLGAVALPFSGNRAFELLGVGLSRALALRIYVAIGAGILASVAAYFNSAYPKVYRSLLTWIVAGIGIVFGALAFGVPLSYFHYVILALAFLLIAFGGVLLYRVFGIMSLEGERYLGGSGTLTLILIALGFEFTRFGGIVHSQSYLVSEAFFLFLSAALLFVAVIVKSYSASIFLQARLEDTRSRWKRFIKSMSHDLRTPLNGLVGLSETLIHEETLDQETQANLSLINLSAVRLANSVNNLLDYHSIQDGAINLDLSPIDLRLAVETAVRITEALTSGEHIEIQNQIPKELPFVEADEHRLEQLLFNLFAGVGRLSRSGTIRLQAEAVDGTVDLVIDSPEADLNPDVYRNVLQGVKGGEEVYENLGMVDLGLQVIRKLVEMHHGRLYLDEDGSPTIHLVLPASVEATDYIPLAAQSLQLESLENLMTLDEDDQRFTVMAIDDDLVILQTIKSILNTANYRVVAFRSGEEALRHLDEGVIDMVLVDVMMPGMNGHEVTREIRKSYSPDQLPVVLLTSGAEKAALRSDEPTGANDFLEKPIHREELITRVQTHLTLAKVNAVYTRFMPTEFLNLLGKRHILDVRLGDQVQREMTVLFVDIRQFTALSEGMNPRENFKFINSYLSRFSPIIRKFDGFVDKYIGDAVMALFPNKPEDAVNAALEMMHSLYIYNGHRAKVGYRPINIGIGIHTGNLIMGIIGDQNRYQGTVISDAVNLASRIQDVTKLYGANIIISQDTFAALTDPSAYQFRFLGKVMVKGKAKSVSLFEVFNADEEEKRKGKQETVGDFERGIFLFSQQNFREAARLFSRIVERNPRDVASSLFMRRSEKFLERSGDKGDGVTETTVTPEPIEEAPRPPVAESDTPEEGAAPETTAAPLGVLELEPDAEGPSEDDDIEELEPLEDL